MRCSHIPLERVLFGLAGTLTLLAVVLSVVVTPWFLLLGVFVAVNQWLFALVGACPASMILGRAPCVSRKVTQ